MKIISTISDLRRELAAFRSRGERIGLVPTMGALHEGHLTLVRRSLAQTDRTVVSIFVNPKQFGPGEDFARYPRNLKADSELLSASGADIVFAPEVDEMYPAGFSLSVTVAGVSNGMEGARRPGHFTGVATVVTRLFCLVLPDAAFFGEKDGQQLAVIQRLATDLGLPLTIVPVPTVREADGLALSSRNLYLSPGEREKAPHLYRSLLTGAELFAKGCREASEILVAVRASLENEPSFRLDALDLVDLETMEPLTLLDRPAMLAMAAFLGKTRLIDNVRLR
ncbi:MAG: Pantothenate synthetase [Thermoanaerobaculia bacterium]|nr:Pantothenate synthetase [Thermoanaerobaculia bacterium]